MGKRLIHGVGINDATYPVCVKGRWCPKYVVWKGMMERCYSAKWHERYPSCEASEVVPEWHRYSTFAAWLNQQDWRGLQLDKDLIRQGNTVYGPDVCVFVPR